MKIEEMLDVFDIDEIEKMSPEECKGLLKGFFIGAGFVSMANENGYTKKRSKADITRSYNPYTPLYSNRPDFRHIRLEFESREDAKEVLDDLKTILETTIETGSKAYVQVHDLYSLADLPTNSAMFNWVWYDLEDCKIERNGDSYILKMPPVEPRPDRA